MGFLERVSAAARGAETRNSIDTWLTDYLLPSTFGYGGNTYNYGGLGLSQTLAGNKAQQFSADLPGHIAALQSSPPAFAAQMVRALVLSQARFTFRTLPSGANPRKLFGNRDLSVLENPWPNATTGELISRMEWHAGPAGNAFVTNWAPGRLRVLRPDWTAIVYGSKLEPDDPSLALDGKILAYVYRNGGLYGGNNSAELRVIFPDQMAHWSPIPDPLNAGLGMSWLTPAIRDIQGDVLASQHKISFLSNGAPQPLDAKVLTPTGWSTMGAMRVGARVVGADGLPHTVLAVYPQGEQDVYRVSFEDGTSAECTLDHLWQVSNIYDRRRGVSRTTSLHDLLSGGLHYPSGAAKWAVPMVDPIEFDETPPLPVDPYLMGLLLGDGSFRSAYSRSGAATLATAIGDADETQALLAPLLPDGVEIGRRDRGGWSEFRFHGQRGTTRDAGGRIIAHDPNPLTAAIVALGLHNVLGKDKFIPEVFLRASVKERVSLLQGLIDSDGHVEATGLRFCTTSHKLASGVAELVGSLGGVATVRPNKNRSTLTVNVRRLPAWIVPARLLRKADKYKPTSATRVRTIVAAELTRRANTQCIAVDSADHLYVTDEYVVTHNTPNMVVKGLTGPNGQIPTKAQFDDIVDMMESRHAGITNAYRTLYLTAGADATVVGSNLQQMDFTGVQGRGETRISVLSRVPAPLLGISEGLAGSSLNAGNFGMARRMFADTWVYPALQDLAAALAPLLKVPTDAELWFDTADMPILREDGKDAAEIEQIKAATITMYVREGFTAESAVAAVIGQNVNLLKHSGLPSVQLQPPRTVAKPAIAAGDGGPKALPTVRSADDDPDTGEWDDDSLALLTALEELAGEQRAGKFNPAAHPRNPKGSPGGGRFRSLVDRIKDAILAHHKGDGKGDPFDGFDREQLRKVAKARGIDLTRGEDRDSIAKKLLDHLGGNGPDKPTPARKPTLKGRAALDAAPADIRFGSKNGTVTLTAAQKKALNEYANDAQRINDQIRRDAMSTRVRTIVRQMDLVMATSGLTSDVEVWRGVGTGRTVFGDAVDGDLAGHDWTEKAFLSTTVERRVAEEFAGMLETDEPVILMRIQVPEGTGAIAMSHMGAQRGDQGELALERGLSLSVVADHGVVDHPQIPAGVRILDVEIPQGA